MTNSLVKDFEFIINKVLSKSILPYKKGNCIRIGKSAIRKTKQGYIVFDVRKNDRIACTYHKTSAVAIAKNHAEGNDHIIPDVLEFDDVISKNDIDSKFYKNTAETTKDVMKADVAQIRYEIAQDKVAANLRRLNKYIF